ncbi:MAG: hypothetical protein IH991_05340, partial [Planctomycetes bacterium]|nr:hypothetical protein [Planctomycetota bacterium]
MLGNRNKAGLSRRIVAYYLVFCLVSIVWLGVSTTLLMRNGERLRSENACLSILGQATTAVELAHLRGDEDDVQRLTEQLQHQHSLIHCAIVSLDGKYLGHSSRELRGKKSREVIGERIQFGDIQAVRFEDRNEQKFREYRAPLKSHGKQFGTLRLTVAEPEGSTSALSMAQNAPIILLTLLSLLLVGGFVLHRMVRPMASIEAQLRQAALVPSIDEA